jgi:formate dehydrogenase subunit delta
MTSRTLDKLIYMANQIAREFGNQRPNDAVEATWDHLWHFWDPRMRAMILAYQQQGGDRCASLPRRRSPSLHQLETPRSQTKATEFNRADDHKSGRNLMSDAG